MVAKIELVVGSEHPAHAEMWLRVLSDELLDLAQVRELLTPAQHEALADFYDKPCAYHPDLGSTPEEREGFRYEEWWAFPVKGWRKVYHQ